jgi:hypothetical protein
VHRNRFNKRSLAAEAESLALRAILISVDTAATFPSRYLVSVELKSTNRIFADLRAVKQVGKRSAGLIAKQGWSREATYNANETFTLGRVAQTARASDF